MNERLGNDDALRPEITEDQNRAIEHLVDTRGIGYDEAWIEIVGGSIDRTAFYPERRVGAIVLRAAEKRPRYSRRGGRAFAEPSDSELDPHYKMDPYMELSESQKQLNKEQSEALRQRQEEYELSRATNDRERAEILAKQRARRERRGR